MAKKLTEKEIESTLAKTEKEAEEETERALAIIANVGIETIDPSLLPPPIVKLVQPTTRFAKNAEGEEVPEGWFLNGVTRESYKEINCTIVAIGQSKVRWVKGEISAPALCRSRDGKEGVGDPGGDCLVCPLSRWGPNNEPPECTSTWNFLGITDEERHPFMIRASGKSWMPAKRFIASIFYHKYRTPLAFKVTIASHKEETEKGKFYVLDFLVKGNHTPQEMMELVKDANSYKRIVSVVSEELEEKDAGE